MWNYLASGLALGCTLVLYDGSPLRDPAYLWNLVDELGITIFGTSAKYLDQLSVSIVPLPSILCAVVKTRTTLDPSRNAIRTRRALTAYPLSGTYTPQGLLSQRHCMISCMSRSLRTFYWALSQVRGLMIRPFENLT